MGAGVVGEFCVPGDDAGLGEVVDGLDVDFLAFLFFVGVVTPEETSMVRGVARGVPERSNVQNL